jgi:hypothetical protein
LSTLNNSSESAILSTSLPNLNFQLQVQVPKDLTVEMYPHYMDRSSSFTSTSILGSIYDEVCRWQTTDMSRNGEYSNITPMLC